MVKRLNVHRQGINLFPWRVKKAQRQRRNFILATAGVALLAVGVAAGLLVYRFNVEQTISQQRTTFDELQQKTDKLTASVQDLQAQLPSPVLGQGLQATQTAQVLHLLTQLPFNKGYLTNLRLAPADIANRENGTPLTQLQLEGVAFSHQEINAIEQTLKQNHWLSAVTLVQMNQHDQQFFFTFLTQLKTDNQE